VLRWSLAHRALSVFVALVVLGGAASTWVAVVRTLREAQPVATPKLQPEAIVWAGRVFGSRAEFAQWLRSRGDSYEAWGRAHPTARAVVQHEQPAATVPTEWKAEKASEHPTVSAPVAAKPGSPDAATARSDGLLVRLLFVVFVIVGAFCVVGASIPSVLGGRFPEVAYRLVPYRQVLMAAGFAIVVGLIVGITQG
jgi:hypothetical protein